MLTEEVFSRNSRNIFRAIHEGKWLEIKYKSHLQNNAEKEFWIGINGINPREKTLQATGMSLAENHPIVDMKKLYFDDILDSSVVPNTYAPKNQNLIDDIKFNPSKYKDIFKTTRNLKILDYLEDCVKLDNQPSESKNFTFLDSLDDEILKSNRNFKLNDEQFNSLVKTFQRKIQNDRKYQNQQNEYFEICLNVLSIYSAKGLYLLAYRPVRLDVANKTLIAEDEIVINKEFAVTDENGNKIRGKNGNKETFRIERYICEDDFYLLDDFESNAEKIKDIINQNLLSRNFQNEYSVDDTPKFVCTKRNMIIKIEDEYNAILKMYEDGNVTEPVKAFFGEINAEKIPDENNPIALLNDKVNLDQLLALYNAVNQNVSYVQGPPGTGKTNTILNVIATCFFDKKTVLFSSYNNHPLDSVIESLSNLKYKTYTKLEKTIPFPVLKITSNDKINAELERITNLYKNCCSEKVYSSTLDKNRSEKIRRTQNLIEILKKHKEFMEIEEQEEAVDAMIEKSGGNLYMLDFETKLKAELAERKIKLGKATDEEALKALDNDEADFMKYLYFTSVSYLQKIDSAENFEFKAILENQNEEEKVKSFNAFLKVPENVKKLQAIFPIMVSTCISSRKIGIPGTYFDITIIDEASQCNSALSLVPILRGKRLMLVGDTNQLSPVITLDKNLDEKLREKYKVNASYDYIENSIYKTFLKNDPKSEEILLRTHYRCGKKIIDFCNKKYYCGKLNVKTKDDENDDNNQIVFREVDENLDKASTSKNTSIAEADEIRQIISENKGKSIGVITPFANQKELLKNELPENISVGTVHQFQGDEKDIIIFSPAITEHSRKGSFCWLNENRELVNVAMSRAKKSFVMVGDKNAIEKLHDETKNQNQKKLNEQNTLSQAVIEPIETTRQSSSDGDDENSGDDFYDLYSYVKSNGKSEPAMSKATSRALGLKPFSSETENAFLETLNQAVSCIIGAENTKRKNKYDIKREVAISSIFEKLSLVDNDLFYSGRFDFVLFKKVNRQEIPILAIELDGPEHQNDAKTIERDNKKKAICKNHNLELIHVDNSYARRYCYIKEILQEYFTEE